MQIRPWVLWIAANIDSLNTTEMYGDLPTTELSGRSNEVGFPVAKYMIKPTADVV